MSTKQSQENEEEEEEEEEETSAFLDSIVKMYNISREAAKNLYLPILKGSNKTDKNQDDVINEVLAKYSQNGTIMVMPVGCGKTRMAIEICRSVVMQRENCWRHEVIMNRILEKNYDSGIS